MGPWETVRSYGLGVAQGRARHQHGLGSPCWGGNTLARGSRGERYIPHIPEVSSPDGPPLISGLDYLPGG